MKCPGIFIVPAEAVTKALEARDFALEADPKAPWYSALEGRTAAFEVARIKPFTPSFFFKARKPD